MKTILAKYILRNRRGDTKSTNSYSILKVPKGYLFRRGSKKLFALRQPQSIPCHPQRYYITAFTQEHRLPSGKCACAALSDTIKISFTSTHYINQLPYHKTNVRKKIQRPLTRSAPGFIDLKQVNKKISLTTKILGSWTHRTRTEVILKATFITMPITPWPVRPFINVIEYAK